MDDGESETDRRPSLYGLTSLDVVPVRKTIPQKSRREMQKMCTEILGKAMSSFCNPLGRAAENGFKVTLGSEDTRMCAPQINSSFRSTPETKYMSAV